MEINNPKKEEGLLINPLSVIYQSASGSRSTSYVDTALTVNNTNNLYKSRARGRVSGPAKISLAWFAVEYLFQSRTNAMESSVNDHVYVELSSPAGSTEKMLLKYDGSFKLQTNIGLTHNAHKVLPLLMWALRTTSPMNETKSLFGDACAQFVASGKVKTETAFKFCDAFYYEWKQLPDEYKSLGEEYGMIDLNEVRGAIRTSNLTQIPALASSSLSLPAIEEETPAVSTATGSSTAASSSRSTAASPVVPGSDAALWEECKAGKLIIDHLWGSRSSYITPLSFLDKYVPNKTFFMFVRVIRANLTKVKERMDNNEFGVKAILTNYVNLILNGKPGTGKTTMVMAISAVFGLPLQFTTQTAYTEDDTYQGMTKVRRGQFEFVETQFLEAYQNGGIILLEEFNLGNPAVLQGTVGQAIEPPFVLMKDGYEEIHRHPLLVVINTMNPDIEGSQDPNAAYASRNPIAPILDDPTQDEFIAILANRGNDKELCERVYHAYARLLVWLRSSAVNRKEIAGKITLRHCLGALELLNVGTPIKEALEATLIGGIAIFDVELARKASREFLDTLAV